MFQKIQAGVLAAVLLLTLYNTYTIHSADTASNTENSEAAFAESINTNAAEIQTLKDNLETMVNFVNAKFENLETTESE